MVIYEYTNFNDSMLGHNNVSRAAPTAAFRMAILFLHRTEAPFDIRRISKTASVEGIPRVFLISTSLCNPQRS